MKKVLNINSDEEMQNFGMLLGNTAKPQSLLLLTGDLGAGKTTLTKGIAKALNIKRPVKSPTFTIVREYPEGKIPLYHMDMYRLEEDGDLSSIDMPNYLNQPGIVVIEWPQFIEESLPKNYLKLNIKRVDDSWDSTKRRIEATIEGEKYAQWWEKIIKSL
ncbi:tRNA (adenosine(37)-N6)-threonylcarbamoyltransferase complex ATPase subunit type 1 TsaE [Lactobacillus sp. PV037]|uniref:tRNA (adenosine(37)-N6)-threonylcarbamoyltransferase complex ATPase subunit type 1 TsaE n=1 Tax=unclassified Lactobacillus TaxID=2620435 RepID=UPI00223F9722|nr:MULTISPECIES: tRNA (adenosine(37)-N6)-threonylcarbamoyltransferase complex ATPase subunit type 1 TsaE [unclassified Lactobacillus]QNQ82535.1 tRNA (adenosine(37)-N6)-threonylcarbamoyltransferase complex ATPase subunit type 1 TsaE [Lactobacillus sp. PV012]QNQ83349.1 tRNA (adenosine(37)-N6)-threonylcarbamoyltransferase complex ATPase subunit type 1 TsaE [Lactobacillus sp. PV037]